MHILLPLECSRRAHQVANAYYVDLNYRLPIAIHHSSNLLLSSLKKLTILLSDC